MSFKGVSALLFFWTIAMGSCANNSTGTAACGDGAKNGQEVCDGENLGDAVCTDLGFYGGTLACDAMCEFNTSGCVGRCGDNIVQGSASEQCDGTVLAGATCQQLGYHGGTLACTSTCTFDESDCASFGRCGDDTLDTGSEDCDGSIPDNITCNTLGNYGGTLACTESCVFDVSGCERCGDGILQSDHQEACDQSQLGTNTCTSLGLPAGTLTCKSTCQYETANCNMLSQFGTPGEDRAADAAMTADHQLILVGTATGGLEGQTVFGLSDGFVSRVNPATGDRLWTHLLGTTETDEANSVALDAAGNIYVTGTTGGSLPGFTSVGNDDAFLMKFNSLGQLQWTRQWGTPVGDYGMAVAVDGNGQILVAGYTYGGMDGNVNAGAVDVFLVKWTPDGTKAWTRQWGTAGNDYGYGVAVDPANAVYVTGNTFGAMHENVHQGNNDVFLTKHDETGLRLWTRQIGTSGNDGANGVAVDPSNGGALIIGYTVGDLWGQGSLGGYDVFVARFTSAGDAEFIRQHGTTENDYGNALFIQDNNLYIVGRTDGPLDGSPQAGGGDAFLSKWGLDGTPQWNRRWGSSAEDRLLSVTSDAPARVVGVGYTRGTMPLNTSAGDMDILVVFTHGLP